jgi:hypothetical protein
MNRYHIYIHKSALNLIFKKVSNPLHAFVHDFTTFAECTGTDCKQSGKPVNFYANNHIIKMWLNYSVKAYV